MACLAPEAGPGKTQPVTGPSLGAGKKNGFRSCNGNSVLSRDLILKEVSELNGIVCIIVRSICKQF